LWMWRNTVIQDFTDWLRKYNDENENQKVAFYGMDLYSFYISMQAVVDYLRKVSPEDSKKVEQVYNQFDRFQGEPQMYGFAVGYGLSPSYQEEVVQSCINLRNKGELYLRGIGGLINGDELFYTTQNAELVKDAEEYYRKMVEPDEKSWNYRDTHMTNCVLALLEFHKKKNISEPKCILWAHNSHMGDASQTDVNSRGEFNIGQLIRERLALQNTFNIGFSTYNGTVTAATNWDEPAQLKDVNPALPSSYEDLFHRYAEEESNSDFYLLFRSNNPAVKVNEKLVDALTKPRLSRYIGVIYRPDTERWSHYYRGSLARQWDAVIHLDETSAVEPLDMTSPWRSALKYFNTRRGH